MFAAREADGTPIRTLTQFSLDNISYSLKRYPNQLNPQESTVTPTTMTKVAGNAQTGEPTNINQYYATKGNITHFGDSLISAFAMMSYSRYRNNSYIGVISATLTVTGSNGATTSAQVSSTVNLGYYL